MIWHIDKLSLIVNITKGTFKLDIFSMILNQNFMFQSISLISEYILKNLKL